MLNNTFSVFLMLSLKLFVKKKNSYALLHTGKIGETFFFYTGMEDTAAI